MKITGTIINYYYHCKRQCWLFMKKINMEDNSDEVKMGKVLHENMNDTEDSELSVENIKLDKISDKYVIEYKKSDADLNAAVKQVQYYLYLLNQKGIKRQGRLEVFEKNKQSKKIHYVDNNEDTNREVEELIKEIQILYDEKNPPDFRMKENCKNCAYFEYCSM